MSCKLYANNVCVLEVDENPNKVSQHDLYNCPNCGAPLKHNYCEYCGTVFKRSDGVSKTLDKLCEMELERKNRELDEYRQRIRDVNRDYQTQALLNQLNVYSIDTQIMNIRDSINTSMASQVSNLHQGMLNSMLQTSSMLVNNGSQQISSIQKSDIQLDNTNSSELEQSKSKSFRISLFLSQFFNRLMKFFN